MRCTCSQEGRNPMVRMCEYVVQPVGALRFLICHEYISTYLQIPSPSLLKPNVMISLWTHSLSCCTAQKSMVIHTREVLYILHLFKSSHIFCQVAMAFIHVNVLDKHKLVPTDTHTHTLEEGFLDEIQLIFCIVILNLKLIYN